MCTVVIPIGQVVHNILTCGARKSPVTKIHTITPTCAA